MSLGPIDAVRPWTYGLNYQTSTRQYGEGPPEAAPQDPNTPQASNQLDCARAVSASPGGEKPDDQQSQEQFDFLKREGQDQKSAMLAELTKEEQAKVQKLRDRDREVRTHEQAHIAAGGQFVRGGASYDYEKGPDGKQYAVGGEVSIDASPAKDPQSTIQKARTIKRAAMAPANPSGQDRKVASKAARMETKARAELTEENQEELKEAAGQKQGETDPAEDTSQTAENKSAEPGPAVEETSIPSESGAGARDPGEGMVELKADQPEALPTAGRFEAMGAGKAVKDNLQVKSQVQEAQSYDRTGYGTGSPQMADRLSKLSLYV